MTDTEEMLSEIQNRIHAMDDEVFEIHEEVVPDDEEHFIAPSKAEILFTIIVLGFAFLLGMVIGGLVF